MAQIIDQNGTWIEDQNGAFIIDSSIAAGASALGFVPVTIPSVDVLSQMISRILRQFHRDIPPNDPDSLLPVFQAILAALASELQKLEDAIQGVMQAFMPQNAAGDQLDAIGRIVGAVRGVMTTEDWFTPDSQYYARPDDTNPVWEYGAPLTGNYIAKDAQFRNTVFAKVFRNSVVSSSIADIQAFVWDLFGINCSVILSGPMQVTLMLPAGTSPDLVTFLSNSLTNDQVDMAYVLPLPPGVQLANVIVGPSAGTGGGHPGAGSRRGQPS